MWLIRVQLLRSFMLMQGCRFSGNTAPDAPSLYSRLSNTDIAADNVALDPADIDSVNN